MFPGVLDAEGRLRGAQQQKAARRQDGAHPAQHLPPGRKVEVDEHVTQEDDVEGPPGGGGSSRLCWVKVTLERIALLSSHSVPARAKCRTSIAAGRPRLISTWLYRPARPRPSTSREMSVAVI